MQRLLPLDLKKAVSSRRLLFSVPSEKNTVYVFCKCARCLPMFRFGTATTATSSDLLCCSLETITWTLRGNCNIYNTLSHGTCETWFPVDLCLASELLELICQMFLEPNLDSTNLTLPFLGSVVFCAWWHQLWIGWETWPEPCSVHLSQWVRPYVGSLIFNSS